MESEMEDNAINPEAEPRDQESSQKQYTYKRLVSKLSDQPYRYLKVQINGHRYKSLNISVKELKHAINMSMKAIFGSMGGVTTIDLLKFDPEANLAIIRCPSKFYVKVRGCLFFICSIGDRDDISMHVIQSSAHLMGLACDSREYMSSIPVV